MNESEIRMDLGGYINGLVHRRLSNCHNSINLSRIEQHHPRRLATWISVDMKVLPFDASSDLAFGFGHNGTQIIQ